MKKVISVILILILATLISACGCDGNNTEVPTADESEATGIIPNDVAEGSAEDIAVRKVVKDYLDTFISCDIYKIKAQLHADDAWLFNFESEDQVKFYEAILPKVTYEFQYVAEHDGVYGVMTKITSPDMAEVYGTIITEYLDTTISQDEGALAELVRTNTERMLDLINDPQLKKREGELFIYVEYINSQYIPRCDYLLANELTGGAPQASDEITSTLNTTVNALTE